MVQPPVGRAKDGDNAGLHGKAISEYRNYDPILSHFLLPSNLNMFAAMNDWAKRLRDRMARRQLTKAEVIRHVRIDHKTLDRFLTGALDHGLQPDQFLRLCEVLAISPNQALGVEPMDEADSVIIDALAPERARILERAQTLPREDRRLVADLLDRLAHHRVGSGRSMIGGEGSGDTELPAE